MPEKQRAIYADWNGEEPLIMTTHFTGGHDGLFFWLDHYFLQIPSSHAVKEMFSRSAQTRPSSQGQILFTDVRVIHVRGTIHSAGAASAARHPATRWHF